MPPEAGDSRTALVRSASLPALAGASDAASADEAGGSDGGLRRWSTLRSFATLCAVALLTASLYEGASVARAGVSGGQTATSSRRQSAPLARAADFSRGAGNDNFEFLMFSQQSTAGSCVSRTTGVSAHCVASQLRPFWTIHGLWPSNATSWPERCNKSSQPFDVARLAPIRAALERYWPSTKSASSVAFWSHEWTRHGRCAVSLASFGDELRYFRATLDLLRVYNATEALSAVGVRPSLSRLVPVQALVAATRRRFGSGGALICRRVSGFAHPVLTEIRFCLSKDQLLPVSCGHKLRTESCGIGDVLYVPLEALHRPGSLSEVGLWRWLADLFEGVALNAFALYLDLVSPV